MEGPSGRVGSTSRRVSELDERDEGDDVWEQLVRRVLVEGEERTDRTGTGTRSIFGARMEWSLRQGTVPLVSSKKVPWEKAIEELLWMLRGDTNVAGLGGAARIWEPWADKDGELGPVYGAQWRSWWAWQADACNEPCEIDQLSEVVGRLRVTPDTRRAVLSSWNVGELGRMALEPCPVLYQFSRRGPGLKELSLEVYQRSADLFLGVPFDVFEAAVLVRLMARELGLLPGKLGWTGGDVHLYENHLDQAREVVARWERDPRRDPHLFLRTSAPSLLERDREKGLEVGDFMIPDYYPHPAIKAEVAV